MTKRILFILSALLLASQFAFSAQRIIKISGDAQVGIVGFPLTNDFVVQLVSDENIPAAGVPVSFVIVEQPHQPMDSKNWSECSLSSNLTITDNNGYARARLNFGYPNPGQAVIAASAEETFTNPAIFTASGNKRNWILMLILECIAGLGLFLFGMFYLNDSLKEVVGQKLRGILITLTGSPLKGISTGFIVTLLNQASSATTVLEVSLVNAGLMTFFQSMAVTMGAELGSTMTAQLIAFKVSSYAVLIIGTGFFLSFFSPGRNSKLVGDIIIGIGIIFLGMKLMSDIIVPIRNYGPFIEVMSNLENPLYGILVGLIFTTFVRSSGVTIGIIIALAMAGAVTLIQAVPVILGAEIGTSFTALIAAIGRGREGERVALWHVFHQLAGVMIVLPLLTFYRNGEPVWIYLVNTVTSGVCATNDLARQIAMSHTLTALINILVFIPLLPVMNKIFVKLLPPKEEQKPFGPIYLDEEFLKTPSLALEQSRKEIVREGEIVLGMMGRILKVFETQDMRACDAISLQEIHADKLRNSVVPYLTKLGQGKFSSVEMAQLETQLLFIADDFEAIGDIIDKNIVPLMRKKFESKLWFSDEGWKDIVEFHVRVTENMKKAVYALKENDLETAKLVVLGKPDVDRFHTELHKRHISRLHSGVQESLETSGMHLDLTAQLRSINSHITAICNTLLGNI